MPKRTNRDTDRLEGRAPVDPLNVIKTHLGDRYNERNNSEGMTLEWHDQRGRAVIWVLERGSVGWEWQTDKGYAEVSAPAILGEPRMLPGASLRWVPPNFPRVCRVIGGPAVVGRVLVDDIITGCAREGHEQLCAAIR